MAQDTDAMTEVNTVDRITVRPSTVQGSDHAIIEMNGIRIIAERADLDGSDNLTFYRDNVSIAHVKVCGVPLEVTNLVRRAIQYGETGEWC